jgi:hypothetical protein
MVVPAPKQVNEGRQWGYSAWARLLFKRFTRARMRLISSAI